MRCRMAGTWTLVSSKNCSQYGRSSSIILVARLGRTRFGDAQLAEIDREMAEMEKIVDQEMRNGAVGISTSLIYLPAMYSTTARSCETNR